MSALDGERGMVAWIANGEHGGGADLIVVPFDADGAPLRAPLVAANVPREATSLVVRPTGRARRGWWVVWTAIIDRGESITLLELAQDGTPRGTPAILQRTGDHVVWADLVLTTGGALCIWAEQPGSDDANVLAASIDADGKPHGTPVRVARNVERWTAVRAGDGVGLALVSRVSNSAAGLLSWATLDANGDPLTAPSPVGREPTVSSDVEVVSFDKGWLLAWTDKTGEDAQVTLATVDATGHAQAPARAFRGASGSSLLSLASGGGGVALAWEEPHGRIRAIRTLNLALVSTEGELVARPVTSLEILGAAPTELAPTPDGFALLATVVRRCDDRSADCTPQAVPTFVRYGGGLGFAQAEPLFLGDPLVHATFAWGLRCAGVHCAALASGGGPPTPVFAVDLPQRTSPFEGPRPPPSGPVGAPRAIGVSTLASGRSYIDVAAASTVDGDLIATLSETEETVANRRRGVVVSVRAFDERGRPLATASTLSRRAIPVGRVAVAAMPPPEGDALVAWVAQDGGDPHVHIALVDSHGRTSKEAQLTKSKGDESSVAIAWANDGWLVAWVDSRDGNGEVYVAKVDRHLKRVSPDRRMTNAPGDAADVSLTTSGDTAWLAWSDPRESPKEGIADVFVTTLSARDGKRKGDEVRVLATAAHSRSPEVSAFEGGAGALLAWIEEAPPGIDAPSSAMFARLDPSGHVVDVPAALRTAEQGRPTAVVLARDHQGLEAVIGRSADTGVTLDAFSFSGDGRQGSPWPIADLDAPPSFDVVLALAGGTLFYDDIGATASDHRVRRVAISW
jgi:hypothetical protein